MFREAHTVIQKRGSDSSRSLPVITVVTVIAGLYFGREVLIPFVLAVLLAFLLTPPVIWLERVKLGRPLSVALVLVVAFCTAGGILWMGTQQLSDIVVRLPQYQTNIRRKIDAIRNPGGSGFAKAAESLKQITIALAPSSTAAQKQAKHGNKGKATPNEPPTPVPVQVVPQQPGVLESFGLIGTSVAHVLGDVLAVVILTLFILVRRSDLRNRLFRLFGQGRINVVTTAMDDAANRVSKYLLTQSVVNCTFGLLLGSGLYFIGVPYAPFWGAAAALLRFIPYIGTLIAGACPLLLALAVFEGWSRPLMTLALFAIVEMTTSGVVEPWLYATKTGISSLAILVSAAFWTALWGPIGLVISTPLTVCLVVLGRYMPQLEFLFILLGDEPVLLPHAWYYQRLLAMDEDEARDVVETSLKDKTLIELYDSVLIPALSLAEQDRHNSALDEDRQKFIFQSTRELIEELGERRMALTENGEEIAPSDSPLSILCIPARDEADELVGMMLVQTLGQSGYQAEMAPIGFVDDMLAAVVKRQPDILFISALPPFAVSHARSLCKRAHQRCPGCKIVVCMWGIAAENKTIQERLGPGCSEYVISTLSQAQVQLRLLESTEAQEGSGAGEAREIESSTAPVA